MNKFEEAITDDLKQSQRKILSSWAENFEISLEEAEMINDPEWIYPDLIIHGHVVAIASEPNGGKTTLMMHIASNIAEQGNQVFYVNADVSGGDAKRMVIEADRSGFKLLLPDIAGKSMDAIVKGLHEMNSQRSDFGDCIFIFDTLKKMTDVINKSRSKELYALLRGLSAKGMTIILLAHTNKYKDAEGSPVFEGTADLRSDVDELIYLIPEKHPDGSITVSTKPDKVRGAFKPISFRITPERQVIRLDDYIDTAYNKLQKTQLDKDATTIELITISINSKLNKQSEIIDHCRQHGVGRRAAEAVLNRYRADNSSGIKSLWNREKAFEKNAWHYTLIESNSAPPDQMYKEQSEQTEQTVQTENEKP